MNAITFVECKALEIGLLIDIVTICNSYYSWEIHWVLEVVISNVLISFGVRYIDHCVNWKKNVQCHNLANPLSVSAFQIGKNGVWKIDVQLAKWDVHWKIHTVVQFYKHVWKKSFHQSAECDEYALFYAEEIMTEGELKTF